jgi:hypothetical protein
LWIENIFLPVYQYGTGEPPFTRIKKHYLQLIEKVLVSSIFFLIYSYLPVIDPSSPAGGEGYFPNNSNILHPQPPYGDCGCFQQCAGRNKPFLKLKYFLWELSGHLCFQLNIVVRKLEKSKIDSFLENIITSSIKCINLITAFFLHWSLTSYPRIRKLHNANIICQEKIVYNLMCYFLKIHLNSPKIFLKIPSYS